MLFLMYDGTLFTSREGLRSALTRIGTEVTAMWFWPAWMMVSRV